MQLKLGRGLLISALMLMIATTSNAQQKRYISVDDHLIKQDYSQVLPPGARLVAGDPGKDEFFILAQDSNATKQPAIAQKQQTSKLAVIQKKASIGMVTAQKQQKKLFTKTHTKLVMKSKHKMLAVKHSKRKIASIKRHKLMANIAKKKRFAKYKKAKQAYLM